MNTEHRAVKIIKMGTLTVYEISEDELRLIEAGDPSSTLLNFGIGALSLGIGILATMLTGGEIKSALALNVLLVVTVLGIAGGAVLLVLWYRTTKRTKSVITTVRERAKVQMTSASITTTTSTSFSPGGAP
jgi:hypothetical protein